MHSFDFIKIFSFDIINRYFYCFAYWLLLSTFLVIMFVSRACFMPCKVLFISSSRFSCFCHRVRSRTGKPQKALISKLLEVLRLHLILNTFLNILCAQDTTLIQQCSKVSQFSMLKVVLLFLEAKMLLRYQIGSFSEVF